MIMKQNAKPASPDNVKIPDVNGWEVEMERVYRKGKLF